jgi:hypothetical protein
MTMAPAVAQNVVCPGRATDLSVVPVPGDTYVWELYKEVSAINFATTPGNCPPGDAYFTGVSTGPTVNVMWVNPGTYFFKVTAYRDSCTMNLKVGKMIVLDSLPTARLDSVPPICRGATAMLTVHLTGDPPWSLTYEANGANPVTIGNIMSTPYLIPVSPAVTTDYRVTTVSDIHCTNDVPSNTVTLIVKPKPVTSPIFHD